MDNIVDTFKVRVANIGDIPGIMAVDEELGGLYPNLGDKVSQLINSPDGYFLVALSKNEIVGYAGGSVREAEFGESDPIGYITHVALKKAFARKGMGKMLGDKLVDKMSDKCEVFRTILAFDMIDLQSYFNQIGFQKSDLMVYEYKHSGI